MLSSLRAGCIAHRAAGSIVVARRLQLARHLSHEANPALQNPQRRAPANHEEQTLPVFPDAVQSSVFGPLDMFEKRHIGPRESDVDHMLKEVGYTSLDDFIADVVPKEILMHSNCGLGHNLETLSESQVLAKGLAIGKRNRVFRSFIGMGYHNTIVPPVILRNVLENPAWYTSYTPYQPEISQGRLESLVNFQTMVKSLTALDIANASLLDEGTAAAEAMILAYGHCRSIRKTFIVDRRVLPQTLAVLRQRAKGFGIRIFSSGLANAQGYRLPPEELVRKDDVFGCLLQYPDVNGNINDYAGLAEQVHAAGGLVIAATDLLALTMIKPPGEWGADIALGNSARFGVPPGFGGPHAAFFAVSDKFKRKMPGRLVGMSRDQQGKPAYRLALQTREQHIRREKATSNICTAQALLANMSAMYAVYHGPDGLRKIAAKVHALTRLLAFELQQMGIGVVNRIGHFFDTLTLDLSRAGINTITVHAAARRAGVNLRRVRNDRVGVTLDETVGLKEVATILNIFATAVEATQRELTQSRVTPPLPPMVHDYTEDSLLQLAEQLELTPASLDTLQISTPSTRSPEVPPPAEGWTYAEREQQDGTERKQQDSETTANAKPDLSRKSAFLTQPVFSQHRSETQMLRYIHHLQSKDLSLIHSMIPLGSCTMKLNATSSMMLLSRPEFASLHPFAPSSQCLGYRRLIEELSADLCFITGFAAVSLQPNSGAQGEFAGLSVIRAYLEDKGQNKRDVCLIPASAHGTNPASAIMAGMRVVSVKNKQDGYLDLDDLEAKATQYSDELAAFMVTYPSTYGVFESKIQEACNIVHKHGGQVYMDGANLQAQVGLTKPGLFGADITHLNLHKTFSIPHGGGGPGVGPICCAAHLAPYLPKSWVGPQIGGPKGIHPVSSAPYGSASILTISWAYIRQLGMRGLRQSSSLALLAANYMAAKLAPHYKLRYTNENGRVAHEFLLDLAEFSPHVSVSDVAKRLSDYSFHAPTCSWPISTGLLVEPTESESLTEMDRFIEAMVSIRKEIQDVIDNSKKDDAKNNVLKNAPHTAEVVTSDEWTRPYSRELAAYPVPSLRTRKFWPPSGRLDEVYGDSNLVCECGSVDEYTENS